MQKCLLNQQRNFVRFSCQFDINETAQLTNADLPQILTIFLKSRNCQKICCSIVKFNVDFESMLIFSVSPIVSDLFFLYLLQFLTYFFYISYSFWLIFSVSLTVSDLFFLYLLQFLTYFFCISYSFWLIFSVPLIVSGLFFSVSLIVSDLFFSVSLIVSDLFFLYLL